MDVQDNHLFQNKITQKKMSLKDLSVEVEKFKDLNDKKDDLIKALNEKVSALQNWTQERYSSLCTKMNETDQHRFKNENLLENKISELEVKLTKVIRKHEEEYEEPMKKITKAEFKCLECTKIFDNKKTLKMHILLSHPKTINCDYWAETFNQNWKLEQHMKNHASVKPFKCDKTFILKWRLGKHKKGHVDPNQQF